MPTIPWGNFIQANAKLFSLSGPLFQILIFQPCVTPTWFSQCWSQCIQWGIEISMNIPETAPYHQHNKELMTIFAQRGFHKAELALMKRCHMFLHVIMLSDICNGTGMGIEQQYWTGDMVVEIYQFQWPKMVKPTPQEWVFWQCDLQLSLDLSSQQQLPIPLGCWQSSVIKDKGWFTDLMGAQLYWLTNGE